MLISLNPLRNQFQIHEQILNQMHLWQILAFHLIIIYNQNLIIYYRNRSYMRILHIQL